MPDRMLRIETGLGEIAVTVRGDGPAAAPAILMWPSLLMDHTL